VRQGNAFGLSVPSAPLTITIDTKAPTVTSATFDYNSAPNTVTIGYSEDVSWSLRASDFELTNLTTLANFSVAHSYFSGKSHVQSITSPILPDGNYRLRVGGVQDIAGNFLPANYDYSFFVLAADANRDRKVDATDLAILSANWQGTNKTFSQGDFNYDGKVDINDLYILTSRWQQSLPPPAALISIRTAPARKPARLISDVL
jgi:hypothetical protein